MTHNIWVAGRHNRPGLMFAIVGNEEAHWLGLPENNIACSMPCSSFEEAAAAGEELSEHLLDQI